LHGLFLPSLNADENKNVFSMAFILVLSIFWGLDHYGIAAVEWGCDNAKKKRKKSAEST